MVTYKGIDMTYVTTIALQFTTLITSLILNRTMPDKGTFIGEKNFFGLVFLEFKLLLQL